VLAVLHEIRHLENAEEVRLRRHDSRRQGEIHGAELELLEELLVSAELARAENDDFRLAFEALVRHLRELVGRSREERAGLTDVTELELRLGESRARSQQRDAQGNAQCIPDHHDVPPSDYLKCERLRLARRFFGLR
jgi:hypothetical protein